MILVKAFKCTLCHQRLTDKGWLLVYFFWYMYHWCTEQSSMSRHGFGIIVIYHNVFHRGCTQRTPWEKNTQMAINKGELLTKKLNCLICCLKCWVYLSGCNKRMWIWVCASVFPSDVHIWPSCMQKFPKLVREQSIGYWGLGLSFDWSTWSLSKTLRFWAQL